MPKLCFDCSIDAPLVGTATAKSWPKPECPVRAGAIGLHVPRRIASIRGQRIARYTLELGGTSPAIILDDFDVGGRQSYREGAAA